MADPQYMPLSFVTRSDEEMLRRSQRFLDDIGRRRTVREFSPAPVPRAVIERCLMAASSAPSGANRQPWQFVVVGRNDELRRRLREAAEEAEREFYQERAPAEWLAALEPLGTDAEKPFLEQAPWLILVFAVTHALGAGGERRKNYYVTESVGIATGMLITALHEAGLATLTHTPSPMGFLRELLGRPQHEKPFLILVTGQPAEGARVPVITKKSLGNIARFVGEG